MAARRAQEIQTAFSTGCVRPPPALIGARAWGRPTRSAPRALPVYACAPRDAGNNLQASKRQRLASLQVSGSSRTADARGETDAKGKYRPAG
jgi:hypothetical protein